MLRKKEVTFHGMSLSIRHFLSRPVPAVAFPIGLVRLQRNPFISSSERLIVKFQRASMVCRGRTRTVPHADFRASISATNSLDDDRHSKARFAISRLRSPR